MSANVVHYNWEDDSVGSVFKNILLEARDSEGRK